MITASLLGLLAVVQAPDSAALLVRAFYEQRGGRLAWMGDAGPLPQAAELLRTLDEALAEGLEPAAYGTDSLAAWLAGAHDGPGSGLLDLRLSYVFLRYALDLSESRVAAAAVDPLWAAAPHGLDLVRALAVGVDSNQVAAVLRGLRPPHAGYARLRGALERYRAIAANGGWGVVPEGPVLAEGARGARVAALRARLAVSGDLASTSAAGDWYDSTLAAAVRRFQARHGLPVDGAVGPTTLGALNVPVADRIRQIALNLERWRWLPRALGSRYLMVNSAAFTLDLIEDGRATLSRRVIVGRRESPTPIVSARATGVAFSPVWNVPRDIAVEEILPRVRARRDYLARERIRVFAGAVEIDPDTVDWTGVTDSTLSYRFVQAPGRGNPLGGVKLLVSNPFNVALHDTPMRELFEPAVRTFSHGCVRVEGAAELAARLLPRDSLWPPDSIAIAIADTSERVVGLAQAVPVLLAYWTAWVRDDGTVEFREDVYGWDARLAHASSRGAFSTGAPAAAPAR